MASLSRRKKALRRKAVVKPEESLQSPRATSVYELLLRPHMPELDTIRGLAILGVLLYHGFYWTRDLRLYTPWQRHFLTLMAPGQFGVNLFFVLSGFLITGILGRIITNDFTSAAPSESFPLTTLLCSY